MHAFVYEFLCAGQKIYMIWKDVQDAGKAKIKENSIKDLQTFKHIKPDYKIIRFWSNNLIYLDIRNNNIIKWRHLKKELKLLEIL